MMAEFVLSEADKQRIAERWLAGEVGGGEPPCLTFRVDPDFVRVSFTIDALPPDA